MDIILAVMYVAAVVGYAATAWLAIRCYFTLLPSIKAELHRMEARQSALYLKSMFDQIAEMKAALGHLVKCEKFEEAKKLKQLIGEYEERAHNFMRTHNECFGENVEVSVDVYNLSEPNR